MKNEQNLKIKLKPKELFWEDCEDYEEPFITSANGMVYGYLVIDNIVDYSLSYYNLFGGETLKEEKFEKVNDAKLFAESHHQKVMNTFLRVYWE